MSAGEPLARQAAIVVVEPKGVSRSAFALERPPCSTASSAGELDAATLAQFPPCAASCICRLRRGRVLRRPHGSVSSVTRMHGWY
jgi:hypothetical protein